MTESATGAPSAVPSDPAYVEAVVDLLGAIAYGELSAFERLAEDAKLAPTVDDKLAMAAMAAAEFAHVGPLRDRIAELGTDPTEAMAPFRTAIDQFHAHTHPADWYEGLVKAFVGDGLAADFFREIAEFLDPQTRQVIITSMEDGGQAAFVVDRVKSAIAAEPRLGGRLALWGRRLMGEALTQAQRVAGERDSLTTFLAGGVDRPGLDLAEVGKMFARITERHADRMSRLGLDS